MTSDDDDCGRVPVQCLNFDVLLLIMDYAHPSVVSSLSRTCRVLHVQGIKRLLDWGEWGLPITTFNSARSFLVFLNADAGHRLRLVKTMNVSPSMCLGLGLSALSIIAELVPCMTSLERAKVTRYEGDKGASTGEAEACKLTSALLALPSLKRLSLQASAQQLGLLPSAKAQLHTLELTPTRAGFGSRYLARRFADLAPTSTRTLETLRLVQYLPARPAAAHDPRFPALAELDVTVSGAASALDVVLAPWARTFPNLRRLRLRCGGQVRAALDDLRTRNAAGSAAGRGPLWPAGLEAVHMTLRDAYGVGLRTHVEALHVVPAERDPFAIRAEKRDHGFRYLQQVLRDTTPRTLVMQIDGDAYEEWGAFSAAFRGEDWASVDELRLTLHGAGNERVLAQFVDLTYELLPRLPLLELELHVLDVEAESERGVETTMDTFSPEATALRLLSEHPSLLRVYAYTSVTWSAARQGNGRRRTDTRTLRRDCAMRRPGASQISATASMNRYMDLLI
ncbi:uncharacterized protein BXZ73DRAFT_103957 [Epithele typhae]|uniref:uncharacterized protein n=1 Tax=Epithele typhae TaxID=378194 RepID=UPI0020088235|nr:uncharacterized protein BXZ73DRAFT_103957 [Epithele typhae]KAH9923159.1 hypothetical protein BXZ73DRAFT_103957 [Epithele typhae]